MESIKIDEKDSTHLSSQKEKNVREFVPLEVAKDQIEEGKKASHTVYKNELGILKRNPDMSGDWIPAASLFEMAGLMLIYGTIYYTAHWITGENIWYFILVTAFILGFVVGFLLGLDGKIYEPKEYSFFQISCQIPYKIGQLLSMLFLDDKERSQKLMPHYVKYALNIIGFLFWLSFVMIGSRLLIPPEKVAVGIISLIIVLFAFGAFLTKPPEYVFAPDTFQSSLVHGIMSGGNYTRRKISHR